MKPGLQAWVRAGDVLQLRDSLGQQVMSDVAMRRILRGDRDADGKARDFELLFPAGPRDLLHDPAATISRGEIAMGVNAGWIAPQFGFHQTDGLEDGREIELGK